ncbi:Cys-tRNA(Pro) deacylase [Pseudodesulfovibrio sp. zrk46]|uniref:Cys-tRNA(Pro) deacylase n=1 Tax=Pseudodesulfovibrio sp. zrk46 TaxID=2725288 RepID=UPI00144A07A6|nr:Cys-tRNA(Pro) deacylase [Pseudodesulfovibrio sp. zrk46]QJB57748.1 Cys-tRNA(Pro) deacylase [Pseudodesulfovibrio sp. zrk46]
MTPAIKKAKQAKISYSVHEYNHDPSAKSYGLEAAEKLKLDPKQVFKTLVTSAGKDLIVAVIPVDQSLDLKLLAKAIGSKKTAMADITQVERVTGYVMGGISPLGQKKLLPTIIEESALRFDTIYVSAGRRGLDIELSPSDLAKLTKGKLSHISR